MKKHWMTAIVTLCLVALSSNAAEEGKKESTPEQKEFRKEMLAKYDTNKDGKIDKEERAKMSDADKQKMKEMRGDKPGQGKKEKPAAD
jgi:Ca2+-binding EF-hand superfamily protein